MIRLPSLPCALVLIMGILVSACSSVDTDEEASGPLIRLDRDHPEAWTTRGYLNVKTLLLIPAPHTPAADEMLVPGHIVGGWFHPDGDVIGTLQPAPTGERSVPCFLVLEDRSLILDLDAPRPRGRTLLRGRFDPDDQLFYPSQSRLEQPRGDDTP
ncbi:MAG TPA: hypothetical protein ENK43_16885 [Planctomycetes bacterium]|nr:hypothetical protein [Planctomycetota bacterium]